MANSLLQEFDLAYLREQVKVAMPDEISIQRLTLTSDKQGGYTQEFGSVYQHIKARLTAKPGAESIAANAQDARIDFTLTVAYDQSIEQTDRITHRGNHYEVLSIDVGDSWAIAKQCQLRKI